MPTTMYHNINSEYVSINGSLVKCSLVLTEVVELALWLMFSTVQNGN